MATISGLLGKMPSSVGSDGTVAYELYLEAPRRGAGSPARGVQVLALNELVGRRISIRPSGALHCVRCGRGVGKHYGEGMCYDCFSTAPEAAECIVRPELCRAHLGQGRDPAWEREHHDQIHAVYLAITSEVKVGVTRQSQVPTRWVDQGAAAAVQIARVPYRFLAGRLEVALKARYTDRTNWQQMLTRSRGVAFDAGAEHRRVLEVLWRSAPDLARFVLPVASWRVQHLAYPVEQPPQRVTSVRLTTYALDAELEGVRGQYLIFSGGRVLNVRRLSGVAVVVEA